MDSGRLQGYADLIVNTGINPDPGQDVVITAGFDQLDFVRLVAETCYRRGAGKVWFNWTDMPLEKLHCQYQTEARLGTWEAWEVEKWRWQAEKLPARIWLDSDDPDGMAGSDPEKRARAQMAKFPVIKPFRDAMENRHQWCIAAVPGEAWARKVFPGIAPTEAVERLWEAILAASRADGDAAANWREHNATIRRRADILNRHHFTALRYRAGNGTDFEAGLMAQGVFAGGAETDLAGRVFNPNIPSEEIFTTPRRGVAEGLLVASKPLSYQGSLIEDFSVRFAGGRAVEVRAARNQAVLEKMIVMDEGAAFLGEVALIAEDSPINRSGILFYNTLFDENASCHVALGRGFDMCVRDYARYSQDEIRALGVNDSMIHVDFMIGRDDLEIDGVAPDGGTVPIFRRGNWCF
ncbi:MAG: aminopeptidase [Lentisphaeria bacterium]|nr:aminopeptidase [Lentisphaeria bacterium]